MDQELEDMRRVFGDTLVNAIQPVAEAFYYGRRKPGLIKGMALAAVTTLLTNPALAAVTVDPAGSTQVNSLVDWIRGTVMGAVATGLATLAVVFVGFQAMSGRMQPMIAVSIVFGIFIVFGASALVSGIRSITGTTA